jgi:hypothetical protein
MGFNPQEEVRIMDNPMVFGYGYEEQLRAPRKVGCCNYRHCKEDLYEGEGYEWDGYLYCSTEHMGEHIVEENLAVDLSA